MQANLETICLDPESDNELLFKVHIEGASDGAPAKVRLVCEGDELSFMVVGKSEGKDVVQFIMPVMARRLEEGTYHGRVEVIVANRYFSPVEFNLKFKKSMKVVAESMHVTAHPKASLPRVSASSISATTLRDRYVARRQKTAG